MLRIVDVIVLAILYLVILLLYEVFSVSFL